MVPRPNPAWAYFFDIDGTLVNLAATPFGVRLEHDLEHLVVALYQITGGAVAIISGRSIQDIQRMFSGAPMPMAGQHGTERRNAAGRMFHHAVPSGRLDEARRILAEAVGRHPGLLLEDKGLSVALHYRQVPRLGGYAHRLMHSVHASVGRDYSLLAGKRVVELKPAGRDKGEAVLEFMLEPPFRGRVPVFVGDDVTDEFGFARVNKLGGVSIKVGPGPTIAQWRLPTVRAVRRWLERGVGTASQSGGPERR